MTFVPSLVRPTSALVSLGPLVFFAALMLFAWRRMANRGGNPMQSFGQTRCHGHHQPGVCPSGGDTEPVNKRSFSGSALFAAWPSQHSADAEAVA